MKKKILVIAGCSLLLASCSGKKADNPWTIVYKNKTISYYDTKDTVQSTIKKSVGEYVAPVLILSMDETNDINIAYAEDTIRYIYINSPDVTTYLDISVGDSASKVESTFEYEYWSLSEYLVMFDGTEEVDPTSENREDDWMCIAYVINDGVVTHISICDAKYGYTLH